MAQISDRDRHKLEEALSAALLLIYNDHADLAMAGLGLAEQAFHATPEMIAKLNAEAADVARTVQSGINQRLTDAQSGADDAPTIDQVQQEVKDYNQKTLQPYLQSFAAQLALIDVYDSTPNPDNPDQSMKDAVDWEWIRNTDWIFDDCQAAEDASPSTYDDLVQIGSGTPPVHRNCACELRPVTPVAG